MDNTIHNFPTDLKLFDDNYDSNENNNQNSDKIEGTNEDTILPSSNSIENLSNQTTNGLWKTHRKKFFIGGGAALGIMVVLGAVLAAYMLRGDISKMLANTDWKKVGMVAGLGAGSTIGIGFLGTLALGIYLYRKKNANELIKKKNRPLKTRVKKFFQNPRVKKVMKVAAVIAVAALILFGTIYYKQVGHVASEAWKGVGTATHFVNAKWSSLPEHLRNTIKLGAILLTSVGVIGAGGAAALKIRERKKMNNEKSGLSNETNYKQQKEEIETSDEE